MSWKIDIIKIPNIDSEKIKYKVEIKKDEEKFKLVYEGKENNCIIKNWKKK